MTRTVLITGPTRGLGRAAVLAMAGRPAGLRPDLILVGRALSAVAAEARTLGARVHEVVADLSRLADVRAAAGTVREMVGDQPLHALIANAGAMSSDTRHTSADGFELTFAVNYLAHAQLISALPTPARVVLLGSNTYYANVWRRLLGVPEAQWRDPAELARPATGATNPGIKAAGVAYSNAKLAILYYAHELQRQAGPGVAVSVFEPGWMPGTDLGRGAPPALRAISRALGRIPGVSTPQRSGPALASVALDDKWAGLRDGAFVLKDRVIAVQPIAHDVDRERRLWATTTKLFAASATPGSSRAL
ncbi:SDR family NAD(P)-dependent oxidoreductase [Actinoplanes sp. TRM 88003]|uniref:SDR family NAD(P)-dependent oxidoreductase n=1 Tax=Paractinoplanes aksuensis TaxID=2939490 RepID=A0ABT1DFI5_9ACTN|nr:SDR family NAD(P)-dependent oxidoreductase [Actinoplanes aksuensis]MCO8269585.1 SDR family NAD(P)-dependent oxidoreductase [Actinoplanes aksuensis]